MKQSKLENKTLFKEYQKRAMKNWLKDPMRVLRTSMKVGSDKYEGHWVDAIVCIIPSKLGSGPRSMWQYVSGCQWIHGLVLDNAACFRCTSLSSAVKGSLGSAVWTSSGSFGKRWTPSLFLLEYVHSPWLLDRAHFCQNLCCLVEASWLRTVPEEESE